MKAPLLALDYMDLALMGIVGRKDFPPTDTARLERARDLIRRVLEDNPGDAPQVTERIIERVTEPRVVKETVEDPQRAILKWKDIATMTGYSRSSIWRMEKDGSFPKRRQLGPRSVGWLREDVEAWGRPWCQSLLVSDKGNWWVMFRFQEFHQLILPMFLLVTRKTGLIPAGQ